MRERTSTETYRSGIPPFPSLVLSGAFVLVDAGMPPKVAPGAEQLNASRTAAG